jgi:hypothetical protein
VGELFLKLGVESGLGGGRGVQRVGACRLQRGHGLQDILHLAFDHEGDRIVAQIGVRPIEHEQIGKA